LKDPADPLHVVRAAPFAALMGVLGVSADTAVVAYDDADGSYAARLWWVLTYYGHANARVLDGGWRRCLALGQPVDYREAVSARATFAPRPVEGMRVRLDELKARHAEAAVRVVDVRPPGSYLGTDNPFGNRRAGHIPGAANLPIERLLADGAIPVLRPTDELRRELARAGLRPAWETVVCCETGVRTALGVLVLSLLGWEGVRAYEASLGEWANRDDTPLARGDDPRAPSGSGQIGPRRAPCRR
jgi:thiosulfate/3-mercaptopyruvate sulfurtransferase